MIDDKRLCKVVMQSYTNSTFNIRECETLIKYFNGFDVIAVRGTEAYKPISGRGIYDLWRDVQYYPWYSKELDHWFHAGMLWGGEDVADHLIPIVEKNRPIIFTGHSMGGGVSLVAAAILESRGYIIDKWVGFGSPKIQVTDKVLSRFRQVNYRHKNDPVPLMPFISNYSHNYHVINIGDKEDELNIPDFKDHPIEKYFNAMKG